MFTVSKIAWYILQPSHFVMILLGLGLFLAVFTKARNSARIILLTAATIIAIVVFSPLDQLALKTLEDRFPHPQTLPANVAGVMILGGGINVEMTENRQLASFQPSADRLIYGAIIGNRYLDKPVLFSGGSPDVIRQDLKEADSAVEVLQSLGIPRKRMIIERQSRNTFENFLYSSPLADPKKYTDPWILVTSARHMPRAVAVAQYFNWKVIPYPVDYNTYKEIRWIPSLNLSQAFANFDGAMKEWVGLAYYYYKGYTRELLPKPLSQPVKGS